MKRLSVSALGTNIVDSILLRTGIACIDSNAKIKNPLRFVENKDDTRRQGHDDYVIALLGLIGQDAPVYLHPPASW